MFTIAAMLSWFEFGLMAGPIWRKFVSKKSERDILIYGAPQSKSIPIIDKQIEKHTLPLSYLQDKSAMKAVDLVRKVINTRAFELGVKKIVRDKWLFNREIPQEIL